MLIHCYGSEAAYVRNGTAKKMDVYTDGECREEGCIPGQKAGKTDDADDSAITFESDTGDFTLSFSRFRGSRQSVHDSQYSARAALLAQ